MSPPNPSARPDGAPEPATRAENRPLRVLLCEPYFSGSHRAWAEGLARHSAHDIELVTHAGGFWKWRMHGSALTLAGQIEASVAERGRPDVLLVSDMVHLPALLGFARRSLAGVPVVLYMHENQLTYPVAEPGPADESYAVVNWLSMAAADRVVFNSEFHRRELLARLPLLLRRFPDHRHTQLVPAVAERTSVLGVGVDLERFAPSSITALPRDDGPPIVLWNHRWEYDKGPADFFTAVDELASRSVDFRLAVAGERFQTVPEVFEQARARHGARIVHFGTATNDEYPDLLRRADIVASTATHEFFGVSMVEAIAAGAFPVLPDRLAYPELVPEPRDAYLYPEGGLTDRLEWAVNHADERQSLSASARGHAGQFGWPVLAPRYDKLLGEVGSRSMERCPATPPGVSAS